MPQAPKLVKLFNFNLQKVRETQYSDRLYRCPPYPFHSIVFAPISNAITVILSGVLEPLITIFMLILFVHVLDNRCNKLKLNTPKI